MEKNKVRSVPSMLPLSIKKDSKPDARADTNPGDLIPQIPRDINNHTEITVSPIQSVSIIPVGMISKSPEVEKRPDVPEVEIKVPQIKQIQSLSSVVDQEDEKNSLASHKEAGRTQNVTPLENCMNILSKVPPEVTISDCGDENSAMDYRSMRQSFTPPLPNLTLIPRDAAHTATQVADQGEKGGGGGGSRQDQDVVNFNNGTNLQIIPQSVVGGVVELDELLKPYKCDMCDRAFRTQENLALHKQQRHDMAKGMNIKYNCKPCRKTFTNRQEWRVHINSPSHKQLNEEPQDSDDDVLIIEETPAPPRESSTSSSKAEKPFACALCGRRFRSPENLKHHEMGHLKPPQSSKEQIFDTVFTSSMSQLQAYQAKYSETSGWQCPVCDTLIYKIEEYNTHILLHYTNMPYKCRDCPEKFTTAAARDDHYQKIHANGMIGALTPYVTLHKVLPEREKSDTCELELMRLEEMENYAQQMGEMRPFECLLCKKRFREKRVFDYHTQLHRGERPFACRCGKYFRNAENFRMHERSHRQKDDLSLLMQQIPNSISVIPHRPVVNNGMDLLVEGKRQLRLDEEDPALRFMNAMNDGENLKCAMCDEEQPNRTVLKQHELWHGRDGEFRCNICGKGFSSLVGIKIHKKKHLNDSLAEQAGVVEKIFDGIKESELFTEDEDSSDERRFSCRVCKKRFKSKQAIPYHMLVHTGETPFVCEICERGFRSLASLRLHQKKHANGYVDDSMDDPPPMEVRGMEITPDIALDSDDEEIQPSVSDFCSVVMMEPEVMIEEEEEEETKPILPPRRPYVSRKKPNDEMFVDGERFFVCHLCPKRFKSRAALTYHSATHERVNKCEECEKTFTSRMRLKKHYKSRHPGARVPCYSIPKMCSPEKRQSTAMETDEAAEEESPVFNCSICERSFRTNHSLVLHKKYNHPEMMMAEVKQEQEREHEFVLDPENIVVVPDAPEAASEAPGPPEVKAEPAMGEDPLQCRVCGKTLKSKAGFEYHMMIHTGEKPYECQYCGKEFRSYNYYKIHENYHERNVFKRRGRPRVNDKICGVNLNELDLDFTPNDRGLFECRVCGKEFKSRQGLPYHMALHTKNRIFRCLQCNLSFRNLNRFQFHNLLTHSQPKEEVKVEVKEEPGERVEATLPPVFIKQEPVEAVEPVESVEVKPDILKIESNAGGYGESSSTGTKALIKKLPDLPDGSLQFQCVLCQRIFRSVQASTYHVMIHTGEKPFRCNVCNYGFRSQANLKKHQCGVFKPRPGRRSRYDGTGEFVGDAQQSQLVAWKTLADMINLKCRKCDQPFKSRPALMYHCMIHTGEKPYKCDICGKHFRSMTNLNLHQKYHERDGHVDRETFLASVKKEPQEEAEEGEGEFVGMDGIPECGICKKTFRTVGYMRQHQRRAHRMRFQNDKTPPYSLEGEEEEFELPEVKLEFVDGGYKCNECGKSFPTKGGYVYHSYTHSGARPYKCRRCSAQYRSSGNLKYHEKTVHKIHHTYGNRRARRRRRHLRAAGKADGDLKLFLSRIDGKQFKISKQSSGQETEEVAAETAEGAAGEQPGNVFEDEGGESGKCSPELNLPKLSYTDIMEPMPLRELPDGENLSSLALDDFTETPELEALTGSFDDAFPEACNHRAAELEQLTENLDRQDDLLGAD